MKIMFFAIGPFAAHLPMASGEDAAAQQAADIRCGVGGANLICAASSGAIFTRSKMMDKSEFHTFSSGLRIANCTPHTVRFADGDQVVTVEPCGATLLATPSEKIAGSCATPPVTLVRTVFTPSSEGYDELLEIEAANVFAVGSIISAQAYPGRVWSLVPVEGFERKPPAEKLYRSDKFNIF